MRILSAFMAIVLCICSVQMNAQTCTTLGQSPSTAFPVCGTNNFSQTNVPSCGGRPIPGPCGLGLSDVNPFYYKFTCFAAGTLGFVITPVSPLDDYDWHLFDITGRNPDDIYSDGSLFVACNWSGQLGSTGAVPGGVGLINCAGNVPINSAMPNIQVGRQYLLMVSNFSNSQQGYTLSFTGGTAGTASITDPLAPNVTTATSNCDGSQVTIRFNKKLRCNSLAANGTDFVINPGGIVVSASSINCAGGFDMDSAVVNLSTPLAGGNYTIALANGTDGNTVLDVCGAPIPVGSSAPFTVQAQLPLPMGTVTQPGCQPSTISLNFSEPIRCNTIAANGSEFTITGPSAVTVTGATAATCANGETTSITLQLSSPIIITGNYQVQVNMGTDGNTLLGSCNRQVSVASTAPFVLAPQPALAMGTVPQPPCLPTFIDFELVDPVFCNTVAANGSDFQITGPSAVTVFAAAPNACDANGQTRSIRVTFSAPISATGNYTLSVVNGSDANTLVGNCGRLVPAASTTAFNLAPQPALAMGTVPQPPCTPSFIDFELTDPIFCNSVAANGSDFQITGASAVTITGAAPIACDANGQTRSIRISFTGPILATGNYTLSVVSGSDANTLVGTCGRIIPAASTTNFNLAAQPPIPMGTIPAQPCAPTSITITFVDSIICSTIAPDGSDFAITGVSAVTINSAAGTCSPNGRTKTITLTLSAPISVDGNYTITVNMGSDGNTLSGNCNRIVTQGSNLQFAIPPITPAIILSFEPVQCAPSVIRFNLSSPILCSSISPDGSEFVITGPAAVAVVSAVGICDANGLTNSIDVSFASPIVVGGAYQMVLAQGTDGNTFLNDCFRITPITSMGFNTVDTVSAEFNYTIQYDCDTDEITFSHDGAHNVNQWTWTVNGNPAGTTSTFSQTFPATSTNNVQLVVTNGTCSDTYTTNIVLDNQVIVDFEVPENICPGDSAIFINNTTGIVETWSWTFGNGNTSAVQHPVKQVYPITGIESSYNISLTASNSFGCVVTETKPIVVLATCIIAVPTAFTPNNDGLNDFLFPLNALKAENLDFKVFNRWGELIFHSKNWLQKWDGRVKGIEQGTGVYVWSLNYTDRDTRVKHALKGTTTLIR